MCLSHQNVNSTEYKCPFLPLLHSKRLEWYTWHSVIAWKVVADLKTSIKISNMCRTHYHSFNDWVMWQELSRGYACIIISPSSQQRLRERSIVPTSRWENIWGAKSMSEISWLIKSHTFRTLTLLHQQLWITKWFGRVSSFCLLLLICYIFFEIK